MAFTSVYVNQLIRVVVRLFAVILPIFVPVVAATGTISTKKHNSPRAFVYVLPTKLTC